MTTLTKKSLTAIGRELGVSSGHLSRLVHGADDREGAYPLYQALRKAGWSLTPRAIEREAAAKIRWKRRAAK